MLEGRHENVLLLISYIWSDIISLKVDCDNLNIDNTNPKITTKII